jgi:hypothetical protein
MAGIREVISQAKLLAAVPSEHMHPVSLCSKQGSQRPYHVNPWHLPVTGVREGDPCIKLILALQKAGRRWT